MCRRNLVWLVILLPQLGGCLPYPRTFPGQIKGIVVTDHDNNAHIPGAQVSVRIWREKSWMRDISAEVFNPLQRIPLRIPQDVAPKVLAVREENEAFRIRPAFHFGFIYLWLAYPMWINFITNDFLVRIDATANGYQPLAVVFYADLPLRKTPFKQLSSSGVVEYDSQGMLIFRLKADASQPQKLVPER